MRTAYVASAGRNRDAARALAAELTERGYRIVSSWHEAAPFDGTRDGELSATLRGALARQCLDEIDTADELAIVEHPAMRGAMFEAGYALGRGKRIVWYGAPSSIFADAPGVERR